MDRPAADGATHPSPDPSPDPHIELELGHEDVAPGSPDRRPIVADVPVRTIVTVIALVLATVAILWLASRTTKIITWVVVSAFFAIVLTPVVDRLNHRLHMPRAAATTVVFFGGIAVMVGLLYAFIRPIVDQSTKFADEFPTYVQQAQDGKGTVGKLVKKYEVEDWVNKNQARLRSSVDDIGKNALSIVQSVFSTIAATLTVAVLTFLMLLQGPELLDGMVRVLSPPQQERLRRVGNRSARAITGYVAGNLAISLIAGLTTWLMLLIAHVPFAGVLALWVAFADLIPLVGATMGAIPAVAVAFLYSIPAGIAVLVFYVIYQQIENHILQPTIMSRTVSIKPLVVFISVLLGVELYGLLGALLAIPVAGVVKEVGSEVLRWRRPELFIAHDQPHAHRRHIPRWLLFWQQRRPAR